MAFSGRVVPGQPGGWALPALLPATHDDDECTAWVSCSWNPCGCADPDLGLTQYPQGLTQGVELEHHRPQHPAADPFGLTSAVKFIS